MDLQQYQEVMTIAELAEYLRINESTAYKLANKGELPGRKVGGSWRFHKDVVDTWLKQTPMIAAAE